jgi:hypothetical protein
MSSCRDTDRVSANVMPMDREPAKIGSNCRRLRRGNGMTAQPDTPDPGTGSYEVIHLGGQAAVVVPVADFLRLRALERAATSSELENAEDIAAVLEWKARDAAGQTTLVPSAEARRRLGLSV